MKVCDKHIERAAVDALVFENDDTRIDICAECKEKVEVLMAERPDKRTLVEKILGKV